MTSQWTTYPGVLAMKTEKNIVLCGFMGVGKSTVGRLLATTLDRDFIDMDAVLVDRFGCSITEFFEAHGEVAFRDAESALCAEYAEPRGAVIATGGGAVLREANLAALRAGGDLVRLSASLDAVAERLERDASRPLLQGDDARKKMKSLLDAREKNYQKILLHADTTDRDPARVVDEIICRLSLDVETVIEVKTFGGGSYDICIEEGVLERAGDVLRRRGLACRDVLVVTNPTVGGHYSAFLQKSLRDAGFSPSVCVVPDGEKYKTLQTIQKIYDHALDMGLSRSGAVIALGGGVVGDMAGFAAATFMRGIDFVQIPTTLLAMVDASVGGKTGVDLPQGKNLVGAFKQPVAVLIDPRTLRTLDPAEVRSGMAEVLKHGIISNPSLFNDICAGGLPENRSALITAAVRVKVDVVQRDPFEKFGLRALLNLGHTFGHAFERVSGFGLRHGEAVGVGMIAAAHLAALLGHAAPTLEDDIRAALQKVGLPMTVKNFNVDDVVDAMTHDKKKSGRTLKFIIPHAIGDVRMISDPGRPLVSAAVARVIDP